MDSPSMSIDLCEVGSPSDCLYSCLFSRCAVAQSRSNLDNSSFLFNLICMGTVPTRWLIRSAYGIDLRVDVYPFLCIYAIFFFAYNLPVYSQPI
jgi:hypothetical protein